MKYYLLSLLFLLSFNTFAQEKSGHISGKVTSGDNTAVEGAMVFIKGLNKQTVTDEKGNFLFKNIPFGKYSLEISSIEIEFKSVEIIVDRPVRQFNILVTVKENRQLKEVSIVAKTEKKELETSGFAVAIIETKEASLRNLTTNE
uniref:beta-sandwich domain-containing protein n=1 Tax=Pseudopedobacter sp. TaxID=1936787 RepID=UPI0033402786